MHCWLSMCRNGRNWVCVSGVMSVCLCVYARASVCVSSCDCLCLSVWVRVIAPCARVRMCICAWPLVRPSVCKCAPIKPQNPINFFLIHFFRIQYTCLKYRQYCCGSCFNEENRLICYDNEFFRCSTRTEEECKYVGIANQCPFKCGLCTKQKCPGVLCYNGGTINKGSVTIIGMRRDSLIV